MEQTIGKRIAENRKRLGLTQDALAEKLEAKRKADADKVRAKDAAIREKYSTAD